MTHLSIQKFRRLTLTLVAVLFTGLAFTSIASSEG